MYHAETPPPGAAKVQTNEGGESGVARHYAPLDRFASFGQHGKRRSLTLIMKTGLGASIVRVLLA